MTTKNSKFKFDPGSTINHNGIDYNFKQLVDFYIKDYNSINHKIYRKIIKKVERKFSRQKNSLFIKNLEKNFPRIESRTIDYDENEESRIQVDKDHQLWLERERLAQIEWKAKKEREERLMQKVKEKEKRLEKINSKKTQQNEICTEVRPVVQLVPIELKNWEKCSYFMKTGVCKYGNLCTRSHLIDSNEPLTTLIFPGMYSHMLLGYELLHTDKDSDEALEYEESDILDHFKSFYDDVMSELKHYGRVIQFLVCSNFQSHLRGNVYVQYERESETKKAYESLNGRFYAGKQLFCYFSHVKRWREAVCSKFLRYKCEKNRHCDYLHVFKNPYNEFKIENVRMYRETTVSVMKFSNKWSSDEETDTSCKENLNSNRHKSELSRNRNEKRSNRSRTRSRSRDSKPRKHKKKSKKSRH